MRFAVEIEANVWRPPGEW